MQCSQQNPGDMLTLRCDNTQRFFIVKKMQNKDQIKPGFYIIINRVGFGIYTYKSYHFWWQPTQKNSI